MTLITCDYCEDYHDPAALHQHHTDTDVLLICGDCRVVLGIEGQPHTAADLDLIEALASGGVWQNVINT